MKKVYVSIPIKGKDYKKQREHADEVGRSLSRKGMEVVNPFNIYAGKDPSYADHLACDLRALMDCDVIFLCQGWENSRGCRIEFFTAQEFGLEVIREEDPQEREKSLD